MTKHAAVAFAEWMSVTYGDQGIRVSCLCPMGVNTAMLNRGWNPARRARHARGRRDRQRARARGRAEFVVEALREERFVILPYPEVLEFFRRKGSDYDRWLKGMRQLQARVEAGSSRSLIVRLKCRALRRIADWSGFRRAPKSDSGGNL